MERAYIILQVRKIFGGVILIYFLWKMAEWFDKIKNQNK